MSVWPFRFLLKQKLTYTLHTHLSRDSSEDTCVPVENRSSQGTRPAYSGAAQDRTLIQPEPKNTSDQRSVPPVPSPNVRRPVSRGVSHQRVHEPKLLALSPK